MPIRFKVVKKDNENYCAVALYSFENLATGRVVDEGKKAAVLILPIRFLRMGQHGYSQAARLEKVLSLVTAE